MNPAQQPKGRPGDPSELHEALWSPKREYRQALRLSFAIGLLMLAPTWYMFEVYGRVVNSRNYTTLVWMLVAALGIYVVLELVELARSRVLARAAEKVSHRLTDRVFDASFTAGLRNAPGGSPQSLSDLKGLTDFIPSPAVTGALDLPAALIVLVLLFLINVWVGVLAVVAAGVQAALGVMQQKKGAKPYGEANSAAAEGQMRAAGTLRNAQVIEAMGMQADMYSRWMTSQRRFIARLSHASDNASVISNLTKLLTNLQGSLLLGLAAWMGLLGDLNGGMTMVIVASILGGRALAPLAQMVSQWRQIGGVESSYRRLDILLRQTPVEAPAMELPAPKGLLTVEGVQVAPPGVPVPILKGVSFYAKPGEMLAIIGPSAAGKSTLARVVIGVWHAQVGHVRLDGADVYDWPKAQLGPHVGYLPQGVELFDGSIAENIARFGKVDKERVRQAAEMVGVLPVIEALPEGFDTNIGDGGAVLSGGQRQRIGLARAIYGSPRLVVLDEPNSSLDEAGDGDLLSLLRKLKASDTTVVAITHRRNLLAEADNVLLLNEGVVAKFGPRDDVLKAIKEANEKAVAQRQEQVRANVAAQADQVAALTAPNPAQGAAA